MSVVCSTVRIRRRLRASTFAFTVNGVALRSKRERKQNPAGAENHRVESPP